MSRELQVVMFHVKQVRFLRFFPPLSFFARIHSSVVSSAVGCSESVCAYSKTTTVSGDDSALQRWNVITFHGHSNPRLPIINKAMDLNLLNKSSHLLFRDEWSLTF